jgi:hypothetical protein
MKLKAFKTSKAHHFNVTVSNFFINFKQKYQKLNQSGLNFYNMDIKESKAKSLILKFELPSQT